MAQYVSDKQSFRNTSLFCCILLFLCRCPVFAVSIAKDGTANAVIVVSENASEPVRHAASELADFLGQVSGAEFTISHTAGNSKPRLLVGPTAARLADPNFTTKGLGSDGMVLSSVGNDLILAGGEPRGTLYAVYTFLEDVVGCRWWASDASTIPHKPTLTIDKMHLRYIPPLEYREPFWTDAFDGNWAVRNKANGNSERLDAKRGGKHRYEGFVHTFYRLIPPKKYFKKHPEWFSEINGKRKHDHAQLCLTNESMRAELIRNLRTNLKKNPAATIASVSQNDWRGHCQCAKCTAVDKAEGSPAGSMLRFVNAVAEDIEKDFPHVAISTLAYQYTRKPPKITQPRPNVIVRLCSIECSFSKPLTDERNKTFADDIRGWSKICNRLYIWDYTTNFRHHILPHPNLRVLGPNIKFFVEHSAKGIFEQGAYTTHGAEMAELRAWVLAKLLWNPDLDDDKLIDEFLDGYYGAAADSMRDYINLMHDRVEQTGDKLGCFADIAASKIKVGWANPDRSKFITLETLSQGLAYLKAAEAAVNDDPEKKFRVQCAQLPVQYAFMMCWNPMRQQAEKAGADWPMPDSIHTAYQDFLTIAKKKKITRLDEWNKGFRNLEKALAAAGSELLVEAESFRGKGGWKVDQQFCDLMGSPYLLAHGMGVPVENAKTTVTFPATGTYTLWVRTKNWRPGNWQAPGRFQVLIDGKAVDATFGTEIGWQWQNGGTVKIGNKRVRLELKDLTGFDGRCDALYFTTDANFIPPNDLKAMRPWRNKLSGLSETPETVKRFDVVIVGGGLAGCGAALAAEQQGLKVALIHDRPVLGGNASEEIRVHTLGITGKSKAIIDTINTRHWPNGSADAIADNRKRQAAFKGKDNITLFLNWRAYGAKTTGKRIDSVNAAHIETGERCRFAAPVFIDCTGDGWVGYWAGADFRYGRESRDEFDEGWNKHGELWSPEKPDNRVMGSSLLWYSRKTDAPAKFPKVPWAMPIAKDKAALKGEWYWEFSDDDRHQIDDAEEIRDHMLCAIYGSFANAKKKPENANYELDWVGYLLGKRESRRLMGDYIYTMKDMTEGRTFADTVVEETREIDVHYQRNLKGGKYDFLSEALFMHSPKYYIPFRCLYSRNVDNLMMAGRCFSCSHVGLGGPRVMNTTAQMGIATGYAAALCNQYDTTPRVIYQKHIAELRKLIGYE